MPGRQSDAERPDIIGGRGRTSARAVSGWAKPGSPRRTAGCRPGASAPWATGAHWSVESTCPRKRSVVRTASTTPDFVPVLSRGRHRRNGARGGCFMEFASFLAGERWSDHPKCTHPLLSALARAVNDCTSDAGRAALVPLIPDVVGLNPRDPRAAAVIALHCARSALAVVPAELARVMAVSVLACERYLAALEGLPADHLSARSRLALEKQPGALQWAHGLRRPGRSGGLPRRSNTTPEPARCGRRWSPSGRSPMRTASSGRCSPARSKPAGGSPTAGRRTRTGDHRRLGAQPARPGSNGFDA